MKRSMQARYHYGCYEPRGALATISNAKNNFEDAETLRRTIWTVSQIARNDIKRVSEDAKYMRVC